MNDFSIFRSRSDYFEPKTPSAALKAFEGGFVPISSFQLKSGSTKPLDEEPYDMEEIERLLSREDLGLRSNIILMGIFEKLIFSHDQETALFAAESINIIENRYNRKIQKLKDQLEKNEDREKRKSLGVLFYQLAILNMKRSSIKSFYMEEARSQFEIMREERQLGEDELNTYIRILLELKLPEEAESVLEDEHGERSVFHLLLQAEILFAAKEYARVKEICRELTLHIEELTEKEFVMVGYWLGV